MPGTVNSRSRKKLLAQSESCCSGSVLESSVTCTTGTFEALNWMIFGGAIPGGAMRSTALLCAEICAMAAPISAPGWK